MYEKNTEHHMSKTPANATTGGRVVSLSVLYLGNLQKLVSEAQVRQVVETAAGSSPALVKLLNDKNRPGFNYAFVDCGSVDTARHALKNLSGTAIAGCPLKVNWAYQLLLQQQTGSTYNVFVGDLSAEVDDNTLATAFSAYPLLKLAHVMWDMQLGRLRGYGFVGFAVKEEAEAALTEMAGTWVLGRAIRLNWAARSLDEAAVPAPPQSFPRATSALFAHAPVQFAPYSDEYSYEQSASPPTAGFRQLYDLVVRQAPQWQTTVYLGNVPHYALPHELVPLLQTFGYVVDFKFHPEKGCAFVKYDTHERAAMAIVQLQGFLVHGWPLKSGWGRKR